jgi:hypothetical protein
MTIMPFSLTAGRTYEHALAEAAKGFETALSEIDPGVVVRVAACEDRPSFLTIIPSCPDTLKACFKHLKESGIHAKMSPGLTLADTVSLDEENGHIYVRSGADFTAEYAQALLAAGTKTAPSSKPAAREARIV